MRCSALPQISRVLNKGFLLFDIIILIVFITLVSKSAICISRNMHQVAVKNTVKQIILFLKLVRERTIADGFTTILIIDYHKAQLVETDSAHKKNLILKLPQNFKILPDFNQQQTNFGKQIKFYPDGHISAGTMYLSYKKLIYKLTISVQQIPIFNIYFLNKNTWQKIIL